MSKQAIEGKGSYALVMALAEDRWIKVGKLGTLDFSAGYYIYFGSALGGLKPRINRHLRRKKKRWWHIDSLTKVAKAPEVWWTVDEERRECSWVRGALEMSGVTIPVHGFGASDCRCRSHLAYLQSRSDVEGVVNVLQRLSPYGLHVFKRV